MENNITQNHIDSIKGFLGSDGLNFFRHLKGLTNEVYPVLHLNQKRRGIPVWPVYLREGMQVRNWMRSKFEEFRGLDQNRIDELSIELIEKAIKL